MWYRFPVKFKEYVCPERGDAFMVGLLYYAMINNYDMEINVPVSERLLFQLTTYYIPMLVGTTDFFNKINISAKTDSTPIKNSGAVGTALSCGVDSFYTILSSLNSQFDNFKVTHVLFTDIPSTIFSDELRKKWLNENVNKCKMVSEELGLDFVLCESNLNIDFAINSFYSKSKIWVANEGLSSLQYCSFVFALQKLFRVYYLGSAGYKINEANINASPYDVLWHDFFSIPNISTENLSFYSSGAETCRIDKVDYISDFEITQKYLFACGMPTVSNCGKCEKCTRTMAELYALGKLDKFSRVYPVKDFKRTYANRIAVVLSHKNKPFNRDILLKLKNNGYSIPLLSYPLSLAIIVEEKLRKKFRNNKKLRKIYYSMGLDVKKYGVSTKEIRGNDKTLK